MPAVGIDLGAQPGGRLIDQVDGFVGQKAIANVALRKRCGSQHRCIGDPHAVVDFVAFLESAQDADGVLHGWLFHDHRLETALQGGIFLDIFVILVQRGRTDQVQFAACQHGF